MSTIYSMKKVFHLQNCSTCQRIIKAVNWPKDIKFQNIKEKNISADELEAFYKASGSYEALFSKRAMKYRSMGLNEMDLTEADFKKYLLEEYTFLKRPFVAYGDFVTIGNSKKVVASLFEKWP